MATNMEKAASSLRLAQKEGYNNFKADIKSINTGSHIYAICGLYSIERGITISVTKYKPNNRLVGTLLIDRFSNYGIEYDNTIIGSLPDSVVKEIRQFINIYNNTQDIYNTTDRYFELVFVDGIGSFSKLIKAKSKPTKEDLLRKYKSFMIKYEFYDISMINEISKAQYDKWKAHE